VQSVSKGRGAGGNRSNKAVVRMLKSWKLNKKIIGIKKKNFGKGVGHLQKKTLGNWGGEKSRNSE